MNPLSEIEKIAAIEHINACRQHANYVINTHTHILLENSANLIERLLILTEFIHIPIANPILSIQENGK